MHPGEETVVFLFTASLSKNSFFWAYLPLPATFPPPSLPQSEDDDKSSAVPSQLPSHSLGKSPQLTSLPLPHSPCDAISRSPLSDKQPHFNFSASCQGVMSPLMVL